MPRRGPDCGIRRAMAPLSHGKQPVPTRVPIVKSLRLFSLAFVSVLAACSATTTAAEDSASAAGALRVSGRVGDLSALDSPKAIAVADDGTTISCSLDTDGSFRIDLPKGHAF